MQPDSTVSKLTHPGIYKKIPYFRRNTKKESLLQLNLTYEESYLLLALTCNDTSVPPGFDWTRCNLFDKLRELENLRMVKR